MSEYVCERCGKNKLAMSYIARCKCPRPKKVFVVVKHYEREGYRLIGIFDARSDAEAAMLISAAERGEPETHRIEEIMTNTYFNIGDIFL